MIISNFRIFNLIAQLLGVLAFTVMFCAFLLQIFTRYVLNNPLGWTTELSMIAFLWMAFLGAGLLVRDQDQVRFDLIYRLFGQQGQRVLAALGSLILAILFLAALPANYDFITFMAHDRTWVLEIRFDYVFAVFLVFLLAAGLSALWRLKKLFSRNWQDEL